MLLLSAWRQYSDCEVARGEETGPAICTVELKRQRTVQRGRLN